MKTILFILVSFIALTAVLSGLIMISNPDGMILNMSPDLLETTPFSNFRIPGLLLVIIVGGINLIAVFLNMQQHEKRYNWSIYGGIVIISWIIIQMILIKSINWLHIVYLIIGVLILLISYQLKGKWAV